MILRVLTHVCEFLLLPFFVVGLINRVKAWWSGRRGASLLQPAYDVWRLLQKTPVYSQVATPLFRVAPWVFLVSALSAALVTPLLGGPLLARDYDLIWFAYSLGLGRMALMLAALDTGSAFEGMGAAREATFSTLTEPALFLTVGALSLQSGGHSVAAALVPHFERGGASFVIWLACVSALFVIVQVEGGRMPVDDPTTHLELTMIHEVMVLDHSGPELAAVQYASALKLFAGVSMLARLLNPFSSSESAGALVVQLALCLALVVVIGTLESLLARLKLRSVPKYVAVALFAAAVALLATSWSPAAAQGGLA